MSRSNWPQYPPATRSNTWRALIDKAKCGARGRKRHIVGDDRLGEALEGESAKLFGGDASPQSNIDALTQENLAVLCLGAKPRRDIAHRADRRIVRSGRKTRSALGSRSPGRCRRRNPIRCPAAPRRRSTLAGRLAHRHRHLDRALGRVGTRHRVVKEHHHPVAREMAERALEPRDQRPERGMVFARNSMTSSGSAVSENAV